MRITSGLLRGRAILVPRGGGVRPTSEKLRAAIFDILTPPAVADAVVLDAFAGSGALGIEALSRGAARASFLDTARASVALTRKNVETLGLSGRAAVLRAGALRPPANPGPPVTLALLDPPYHKDLIAPALDALRGWLAPECVCVLESEAGWAPALPDGFSVTDARRYGDTAITFSVLE